jgi:rhamnosyltransferase
MAKTVGNTALIVPTLNAGTGWSDWLRAFELQTVRPEHLLVIDSSSSDETPRLAAEAGFNVHQIHRRDFNHGSTRQLATTLVEGAEFLIYMTQDAVLARPDALEILLGAFEDDLVGAAYGRQLPRSAAHPIEAHARLFNYAAESQRKTLADAHILGIKATFLSDSFAAYRRTALESVGGFPHGVLFGEDATVAGRLILAGWHVQYCAEAHVRHSHAYTYAQEFKRYFDVGVFHAREAWLRNSFGSANGEGLRFVRSELAHLRREAPSLIPSALIRTVLKLTGYRLGIYERYWPRWVKQRLSMFKPFWDR